MSEALLQQLLDAGTPPLLVARVAAELARAEARAEAAKEPSKGALRTRAWRERHQASPSVTCDARDAHVTESVTAPPTPDKSPPDPQKLTPTPPTHETRPPAKARGWPCPADVDPQHWADFLTNRDRKRLARTPTALKAQMRALSDLADDEWPPGRIVQFAAERGWGAIFDPRGRDDGRRTAERMGGDRRDRGHGPTIDAALDWIGGAQH